MKNERGHPVTVTPWLKATLDDDPSAVAQWVADYNAALPDGLRFGMPTAPVVVMPSVVDPPKLADDDTDEIIDVEAQLKRFTGFWKARAPFLLRLHEGLVALGYEPKVPEKRTAEKTASYLSYIDPVDGRNLLNVNSGTAYFQRKDVGDALAGHPFLRRGPQPAVEYDSDEKVDFLLEVAEKYKK